MKVLFLGSSESPLVTWLQSVGEEVVVTMDPLDGALLDVYSPDFLVSYGYLHIIKQDVLCRYPNRAINLHISYLPWNRGKDPNFWSFVDDTPKGVTIHYLDEGVDTGDIIVQTHVAFSERETLRTSYDKLQAAIQALFKDHWARIRTADCPRRKQAGPGTSHRLKDAKERFPGLLVRGWDTPTTQLEAYAADTQMSRQLWEKYDAEIEEIARRRGR